MGQTAFHCKECCGFHSLLPSKKVENYAKKLSKILQITVTTDFIDTRSSNKNFREHLVIRFRQSFAPYMVLQECRCYFQKIWRPLCSLFGRHGCFLFFKFTMASGVFACAGVEHRLMEATLTVIPLATELSHPCISSSYTPGYCSTTLLINNIRHVL